MFMSKFAKGRLSVEPIICYILHAFRIGCCCDYYDWGQCICGLHDRNIKYQIKLFYIGVNKYHTNIYIYHRNTKKKKRIMMSHRIFPVHTCF